VRGTWSEGRFAPEFKDAGDVGFAVVRALNAWRQHGATNENQSSALERARSLALGSGRAGQSHTGAKARVVIVPISSRPIMDAVMLGEASLGDELGMSVRTSGLVRHDMAMKQKLTADGVEFEAANSRGYEQLRFLIATDGAILAEGAVSGSGMLGSSVIEVPNVRRVVEQSCAFALGAWTRIDRDTRGRNDRMPQFQPSGGVRRAVYPDVPRGLPLHSDSSLALKEPSVARLLPRCSLRRSRARSAASELALWRSPSSAARTAAGSGGSASAARLPAVHATQRVQVYLMGLAAPFLRYSSGTRLPTY
jgi:hypothetical protein